MAPLKTRQDLQARFVRNAIPTEQDFRDLIDSPLNQSDDGVFRNSGEPLSVVAVAETPRRCVRLYWDTPGPAVATPDWLISLNPPQSGAASGHRRGLGVADGAGNTRLFLDAAGNLGVGTNDPQTRLHVVGGARVDGALAVSGASTFSGAVTANTTLAVTGELTTTNRVTVGRADGTTELVVRGALQAARSDIYFTNTTHQHTGFGNTSGFAAIENATDYNALMILGRQTAGGRIVKLWDFLEVNGNMSVNGSLSIGTTSGIPNIVRPSPPGAGTLRLGDWLLRTTGDVLEIVYDPPNFLIFGPGGASASSEKRVARFSASASVSGSNRLTFP
jgi:hypothetical protein